MFSRCFHLLKQSFPGFASSSQSASSVLDFQAAKDISASYDALVDLFECVESFLKRLKAYRDTINPRDGRRDRQELLSILALATKQIKQGRFSKRALELDLG